MLSNTYDNVSTFLAITWNIEGISRNVHNLKYLSANHIVDFIFLSEPQIYQNDIEKVMEYLRGEYSYALNSMDKQDPELPLVKSKAIGGSMILWNHRLDPYVTVHPVNTSSFLPIIFSPPDSPVSIHVSVYLPTHGQDEKFVEELSALTVCLDELLDLHPDAPVFLRGDFNVSNRNIKRSDLLKHLCAEADLREVPNNHPTYHHFMGDGKSDSHLDKILYSKCLRHPETIKKIYCKHDEPAVDSHHDLIVSEFYLPISETESDSTNNITAPKVDNHRTKVFWSEDGIEHYQRLVAPELHRVQQLWLTGARESKTSLSLLFKFTNDILSKVANETNKTVKLNQNFKVKSKKVPSAIKKSACLLRIQHRKLKDAQSKASVNVPHLRREYNASRAAHQKLSRRQRAAEASSRDSSSFSILGKNPSPLFKHIKASRHRKSAKIRKLLVSDKTYLDENVPDGFYDSISTLKTRDHSALENSASFQEFSSDYQNILEISKRGDKIPSLSEKDSLDILMNMKPDVNDFFGLTPNHYIYAGCPGWFHFHLQLNLLINNVNNTVIQEVNTVYACILFKGHDKDKNSDRSYRTISTCPVTAKALDIHIRNINITKWNSKQSNCQFQGTGSSHDLASLLLTECLQHSIHHLKQPIFILYLDAKSAFDLVQKELLVKNLYTNGTNGETLLYINNRLENRSTVLDWNGRLMGPIKDQQGLEQGGVSSSDWYKIFSQEQLQLLQESRLGVPLGPLTVSGIGQADDTLIISNNIKKLRYLLELTKTFCSKYQVQLCADKTRLQVYFKENKRRNIQYLKEMNPIEICGNTIEYNEIAEHVGVTRSINGNLPSLISRITAHKKALGGVLHTGMARSHRGNPAASLRLQQVYANSVLFSGLGSLLFNDNEINVLAQHHKNTINNLQKLLPRTPQCVIYFLGGTLPAEALLHQTQLSIFGMITRLPQCILYSHALNIFKHVTQSPKSWFLRIRDLCLKYNLPHPSTLLLNPPNKEQFKTKVKKSIIDYWEQKLRSEATPLQSLEYFHPTFMSLRAPHPLWLTASSSPTKVVMAIQQARLLSGRYRLESLTSHWTNSSGHCRLSPVCETSEDIIHFLKFCSALDQSRRNLFSFTEAYCASHPVITNIIQTYCTNSTEGRRFCQFILDCSVLPEVVVAVQNYGTIIHTHLFNISRIWCYTLHRERLKLLGRWRNFTKC